MKTSGVGRVIRVAVVEFFSPAPVADARAEKKPVRKVTHNTQ
jgi:hypothetical protein